MLHSPPISSLIWHSNNVWQMYTNSRLCP
jgi:hypothetical protein